MTKVFGHSIRSEILVLYLLEGLICFVASYAVLSGTGASAGTRDQTNPALVAALLTLSFGLAGSVSGLYRPTTWLRVGRIFTGAVIALLFLAVLAELLAPSALYDSNGSVWLGVQRILPVFALSLVVTRISLMLAARFGLFRRRLIVVQDERAEGGLRRWPRDDPSFEIVPTQPSDLATDAGCPGRNGHPRPWAVVAERPEQIPPAALRQMSADGIHVLHASEFWERRLGRLDLAGLPDGWVSASRGLQEHPTERALRRGFDILASLLLLAVTLPLLLLAIIALKLDSPGPIFYRQERVGQGGRRFLLFKLRSMVQDAEAAGAPRWAVRGDSRVTRVGRILRLFRIDEIPQVLNVLRGDMAFVGPRPERPAFVEQLEALIPHYSDRAVVKPGITGWAQVNYPYGASVEDAREKLTYDLYYVKQRSLFLDLLILIATVRVVLFQEGSR
ncbi:exopolysaccharide biosynthesis polyprenyl glycosylphosphotransferase [Muricoccus radiodurans]|uniref:exopolysaccharide biosynthesis polyprenyl glycosylphosphotransferase n=1 Tax=Muricoccus radiodurans TaxID=2231721 RepID=UPI003CECBB0C